MMGIILTGECGKRRDPQTARCSEQGGVPPLEEPVEAGVVRGAAVRKILQTRFDAAMIFIFGGFLFSWLSIQGVTRGIIAPKIFGY